MGYETRTKIEGHKRIVREGDRNSCKYRIYNRHCVSDSESGRTKKEWFDSDDVRDIRSVFNLVRELKRKGNYVIWYENYACQDLEEFEGSLKDKKEVFTEDCRQSSVCSIARENSPAIKHIPAEPAEIN